MNICPSHSCTGCSACANLCPSDAISMHPDSHGFLHPSIDVDKCTSCSLCRSICPQNRSSGTKSPLAVYAGLSKDDSLRHHSSSGGIFSELAKNTLKKKGVVFGAAYDDSLQVHHIGITEISDLHRLRGSKYVQSNIGTSYAEARKKLQEGYQVLFTGTPCQIAGLYSYLCKDYSNLVTMDILCHGVPSPEVYKKFIDSLQKEHAKSLTDISFRSKIPGWKTYSTQLTFADNTTATLPCNSYMSGFLNNVYLRNSCSTCRYATASRPGDITLGDYWGYRETAPDHIEDDDHGISLIMCNSQKGILALKKITGKLALTKRSFSNAAEGNPVLIHPFKKSHFADAFWEDFPIMSWNELSEKYFPVMPPPKDPISPEDRNYYAIPYIKRHRRHLLHCLKVSLLKKLRRK